LADRYGEEVVKLLETIDKITPGIEEMNGGTNQRKRRKEG